MEKFLLNIFAIIDKSLTKKLRKLESKIKKNRREFNIVKEMNNQLQDEIFEIYNMQDDEPTASEQIGFMFRMVQKDAVFESFENFDISKVINEDQTLSHKDPEVNDFKTFK